MADKPPPLAPEIRDAWGRVYIPRQPSPNSRAVSLHAADLLGLWIWCSQAAVRRQEAGETEEAMKEHWRSVEFARIAIELQPFLREYIDLDGRVRGLDCVGSA